MYYECFTFQFTDADTSETVGVQYVAPAATGRSNKNPSVRVFSLDSTTFQVLDFDQYHMDLRKAAGNYI